MKWFAIIISILIALTFLFLAMAAALFAIAGDDVMKDEQNKKRQESISKTKNKRK